MNICNLIRQIQKCMQICIYHIYIYISFDFWPKPFNGQTNIDLCLALGRWKTFSSRPTRKHCGWKWNAMVQAKDWWKWGMLLAGVCMYVCMHACMCIYVYIYICDYVCSLKHHLTVLFTRIQHIHTYIHIYIYLHMYTHVCACTWLAWSLFAQIASVGVEAKRCV